MANTICGTDCRLLPSISVGYLYVNFWLCAVLCEIIAFTKLQRICCVGRTQSVDFRIATSSQHVEFREGKVFTNSEDRMFISYGTFRVWALWDLVSS